MVTTTFETIRPPRGASPARARVETDAASASLDGTWKFTLSPTAATPADPTDRGDDWGTIEVPGHWQLQGHGSPIYTNQQYPFPVDPPFVPDANPTGEYRTVFVKPEWDGGRTLLRFDGVDSWFELWVNGQSIGDSSGSRLAVEFDVTDALVDGENLVALRVHQWSFASYVEDQDQWWLSGIFRSVALLHRPAGGIDDVFVHAGYDAATGAGTLQVEVAISTADAVSIELPELDASFTPDELVILEGIEPWSAEVPRLYELVVSTPAERITLHIGFRTISIDGPVLLLNGEPITFRGVNRHDFDPRSGRAVSRETMEDDVRLMKRHNMNAVRTSHYPPDPYFLDLCDRYGLYVIDECDLETHGFSLVDWRGNPSGDPQWADVYLDRMRRTVERDKNHTSVVIWSLGNEAGWGENLAKNAEWTRDRDPERPIHYEQDAECEGVDIYSRMYATFDELDEIGRQAEPRLANAELDAARRDMPMIQCEYAHAMGNGPGGLEDYERIFDAYPRLAGGFVWEWFDHGIEVVAEDGSIGYAYGGDFGERIHDGSFVVDGLLLPDRTPSPGLIEYAAVIAPFRFLLDDDGTAIDATTAGGTASDAAAPAAAVSIENRLSFQTTDSARFSWVVEADGVELASGDLDVPTIAPRSIGAVALPEAVRTALAGAVGERFLTFRAVTADDAVWADAGHVLAIGQHDFGVGIERETVPARATAIGRTADGGYAIADAVFDRRGVLIRLAGAEVLTAALDAWRAPTENDRYPGLEEEPPAVETWRIDGLDRLEERGVSLEVVCDADGAEELVRRTRVAGANTDVAFDAVYRWRAVNGALSLELTAERVGEWRNPLPRLGLTIGLAQEDAASVPVSWFGQGPAENYPDSQVAARVGRFGASVAELQTNYVVPQDNGYRMDTRTVELGLTGGALRIDGHTPFDLAVRPWSIAELERATHANELHAGSVLWLHLDAGINGVGSATCGPSVRLPERLIVSGASLGFTFTVLGV